LVADLTGSGAEARVPVAGEAAAARHQYGRPAVWRRSPCGADQCPGWDHARGHAPSPDRLVAISHRMSCPCASARLIRHPGSTCTD